MQRTYQFDRLEIAGSLGDLGTLLPLAVGMVMINGLSPAGVFFTIGIYYILSGAFFRITVPVQPMKIIGAYAIATGMSAAQISASGLLMALLLLLIGTTGLIRRIGIITPKPVIRGVQMSTGILLMVHGIELIIGSSKFQVLRQMAEPYLSVQSVGGIPIGIIIGVLGATLTFFMLDNRKLPAALLLVVGGAVIGIIWGNQDGFYHLNFGLFWPAVLPFGLPSGADFTLALLMLVLPQIPMTIGNAVLAYADLSEQYFGPAARRATPKNICISMALANLFSTLLGGIPLCHGAGGLAAHFRFGARTAGSNLFIGIIFAAMALFLGKETLFIVNLLPLSVLGVLLFFAGSQLALTIVDLRDRKDIFIVLIMLGLTLAINLTVGFLIGIISAYLLKKGVLSV